MPETTDPATIESPELVFALEGLTLPPTPAPLGGLFLRKIDTAVFATAPLGPELPPVLAESVPAQRETGPQLNSEETDAESDNAPIPIRTNDGLDSDADREAEVASDTDGDNTDAATAGDITKAEAILKALLRGEIATPFMALGFAGHGMVSQAVHYYLATPEVIVILQKRWASFIDDPDEVTKECDVTLRWSAEIATLAAEAALRGRFPRGRRMVVFDSTFVDSRFAWVPADTLSAEEIAAIEWDYPVTGALIPAMSSVLELARPEQS